jgi:hypothetical protein
MGRLLNQHKYVDLDFHRKMDIPTKNRIYFIYEQTRTYLPLPTRLLLKNLENASICG